MLSSKQRSYLRGLANPLDPIFQVGKGGITDNMAQAISAALTARELIKVRVLKNADDDVREVAELLANQTKSEVVQVIGHSLVLYRRNTEEPKIQLP